MTITVIELNAGYVTGDNNQLLSDGVYNYEYDNEGNRVKQTEIATGEVTEYQWDHRNRLVAAVTKDTNGNITANSDYTYDVFDNRISKSVDADGDGAGEAVEERYVLDEDHIALTFDGEGNLTERFLHGLNIDQVLAQENDSGEVLWALTDHQNSVRVVLDRQGNVVNQISYDSFGQITNETNPDVDFRFSYTGREFDAETGNYYYRARYYDPSAGRFISEDPISFAAGDSNIYRYVGNNPLFYLDPSGFCGVSSSGGSGSPGGGPGSNSGPGSPGSGPNSFGGPDFFGPGGSGGSSGPGSNSGPNSFGGPDFFGPGGPGGSSGPGSSGDGSNSDGDGEPEFFGPGFGPNFTPSANGDDNEYDILAGTTIANPKSALATVLAAIAAALHISNETNPETQRRTEEFDEFIENQGDNNQPLETTTRDNTNEFDPNINIGTYEPPTDPFNVETFPRNTNADDFLNADGGYELDPTRRIEPIRDFTSDFSDLPSYVFDINHRNTGKNAAELRDNMIQDGITFNPGDQAHHIVPSTDKRTQEAREVRQTLEDFNIDINDPDNGVPLTTNQHQKQGLHRKDAYREINRRLNEANNAQDARNILRDIGNEMKNGTFTFPTN
ncbi:MAG: RHS repeat-associated core domain-containing protein [Cyanobacteria bacterium P01_A01_bin.40]